MNSTIIKSTKTPERPAGAEGNFYELRKKIQAPRNERACAPFAKTKC